MLKTRYEKGFRKDLKRMQKRGYDIQKVKTVIEILANQQHLPKQYQDHSLSGNYAGFRECHGSEK